MLDDHLQRRVDDAVGTVGQHPLVGHEDVLDDHVVAPRAPHAQGVPVVEDGDALTEGHRHVEDAGPLVRVVVAEHRRHDGAGGRLAGEDLATGDPVAAVDLDRLATRVGEVGAAGRDEQDALVGDAAQGGLGAGEAAAIAPRGEGGDVLVHRARQRGRAAVVGELALDGGRLAGWSRRRRPARPGRPAPAGPPPGGGARLRPRRSRPGRGRPRVRPAQGRARSPEPAGRQRSWGQSWWTWVERTPERLGLLVQDLDPAGTDSGLPTRVDRRDHASRA